MERAYLELISGQRRGPLAALFRGGLAVLEVPYRCAVVRRNRRFDRGRGVAARSALPVVSVGNLTVGGTGKTPMVEWLVDRGRREGTAPGILLRGYRRERGNALNDEGRWLARCFPEVPILAQADRVAGVERLRERGARWVVLDDGFQHRRLPRDLDVVLVDATRPDGYGHVLPRGLLREPMEGLRRAQVAVLTRVDQVAPDALERLARALGERFPEPFWTRARHAPAGWLTLDGPRSLDAGERGPVNLVSGLAHPRGFERTVADLGYEVRRHVALPDHHGYRPADLAGLSGEHPWLTTTKDWVKLEPLLRALDRPPRVRALRIAFELTDAEALWARVRSALARASS